MNVEQGTMDKRENGSLFRYRRWPVYEAAKSFRRRMRRVARDLPESERCLLRDQMSRAADSICLNTCPVKSLEVEYVLHVCIAEPKRQEILYWLHC
jgi:four helix bundle protein